MTVHFIYMIYIYHYFAGIPIEDILEYFSGSTFTDMFLFVPANILHGQSKNR